MAGSTLLTNTELPIDALNKALEVAILLRSSEAGHARDYRNGTAFGQEEDRRRLDAFTLGVLDAMARTISETADPLPLLAYLKALHELGPGVKTREAAIDMLTLRRREELRPYIAAGRRIVVHMLSGKRRQPGIFAELLEEEIERQ